MRTTTNDYFIDMHTTTNDNLFNILKDIGFSLETFFDEINKADSYSLEEFEDKYHALSKTQHNIKIMKRVYEEYFNILVSNNEPINFRVLLEKKYKVSIDPKNKNLLVNKIIQKLIDANFDLEIAFLLYRDLNRFYKWLDLKTSICFQLAGISDFIVAKIPESDLSKFSMSESYIQKTIEKIKNNNDQLEFLSNIRKNVNNIFKALYFENPKIISSQILDNITDHYENEHFSSDPQNTLTNYNENLQFDPSRFIKKRPLFESINYNYNPYIININARNKLVLDLQRYYSLIQHFISVVKYQSSLENISSASDFSAKPIIVKSIPKDITRIFEAMLETEIISSKTEVSQIGQIFANDKDINKFVSNYFSYRSDLKNSERKINSRSNLFEFILKLTDSLQPHQVEKLIKHLEKVQNKY